MNRELNIICETCHKPMGEDDNTYGNLWISDTEWHDYSDAYTAWKAKYVTKLDGGGESVTGAGIGTRPQRVRWHARHGACDTEGAADLYSIPSPKLQTGADLVEWTAHLMEKTWLDDTNWRSLIRAAANGEGSIIVPVVKPVLNA